MNEQQRISYWQDYSKIQLRLERRFLPVINKVLANQISSFTDRLLRSGIHVSTDLQRVKGVEMALVLSTLHVYCGVVNGHRVYKMLKQHKKTGGPRNRQWTQDVLEYFKEHNLKLVKNITDNTKARIQQVLKEGTEKGYGAEKTARMLKADGFTKARALRIVRTESVRATNYGSWLAAFDLGIKVDKQWIATHDSRTRDTHMEIDGQVIEMDGSFRVPNGDELFFPGDPEAPAAETINCRCTMGFIPIRNEVGRIETRPDKIPFLEPQEVDIPDLMMEIFSGAVPGFIEHDLLTVSDQIITFVKEIFTGIGLKGALDKLFDKQ